MPGFVEHAAPVEPLVEAVQHHRCYADRLANVQSASDFVPKRFANCTVDDPMSHWQSRQVLRVSYDSLSLVHILPFTSSQSETFMLRGYLV